MEINEPKENLALTFLEIARSTPKRFKDTTMMYCEQCGERTEHSCTVKGDWEIFTCLKGTHMGSRSVRVR